MVHIAVVAETRQDCLWASQWQRPGCSVRAWAKLGDWSATQVKVCDSLAMTVAGATQIYVLVSYAYLVQLMDDLSRYARGDWQLWCSAFGLFEQQTACDYVRGQSCVRQLGYIWPIYYDGAGRHLVMLASALPNVAERAVRHLSPARGYVGNDSNGLSLVRCAFAVWRGVLQWMDSGDGSGGVRAMLGQQLLTELRELLTALGYEHQLGYLNDVITMWAAAGGNLAFTVDMASIGELASDLLRLRRTDSLSLPLLQLCAAQTQSSAVLVDSLLAWSVEHAYKTVDQ